MPFGGTGLSWLVCIVLVIVVVVLVVVEQSSECLIYLRAISPTERIVVVVVVGSPCWPESLRPNDATQRETRAGGT